MTSCRALLAAACLTAAAFAAGADCPAEEADGASLLQGRPAGGRGQRPVHDVLVSADAEAQKVPDKVTESELARKEAQKVTDKGGSSAAPAAGAGRHAAGDPQGGSSTNLAELPPGGAAAWVTRREAVRKSLAEFFAMALFVIVGCGSACGIAKKEGSAWILQVALTFGFAITVLAYAIGHYSGAQINCAVTFGLVLAGELSVTQGLYNLVAQLAGSVVGALVLRAVYSDHANDLTGGLGCNSVSESFSKGSALLGEIVGTFVLMFVVLEVAVNPMTEANRTVAPLAIGLAVFLAHSVLIPIDGCSINPTRSFGPALVAALTVPGKVGALKELWVFWLGPLLGAALAVPVYSFMAA